MKKITPLLLAVALCLSLVGCDKKIPEISQETLFFENTTWGITKAETLKALKLKDSDLEKTSDDVRYYIDTYKVKDYKYNNVKCDVLFGFSNGELPEIKQGILVNVKVNTSDKKLLTDEIEKLSKQFTDKQSGSTDGPIAGTHTFWGSTKSIKDFVVDNKIPPEKAFYIGKEIPEKQEFSEQQMLEKLSGTSKSIAALSVLQLNESDENGYVGYINFNGEKLASLTTLLEK